MEVNPGHLKIMKIITLNFFKNTNLELMKYFEKYKLGRESWPCGTV